jgi:hypothetical protein
VDHQHQRRCTIAAATAALALALTGCFGDDSSDDGASRDTGVAVPTVDATVDEVPIEQAESAACSADFATLVQAVELYFAVNGEQAASEDDLIEAGFLRSASKRFDVRADGIVVAEEGSGCTSTDPAASGPTSVAPTATVSSGSVGAVSQEVCDEAGRALAIAVIGWTQEGNALPVTEDELVAAGHLEAPSPYYDLGPAGEVVAVPGSGCI